MRPIWSSAIHSSGSIHYVEDGQVKFREGFGGFVLFMLDAIINAFGAGYTWEIRSYNAPKNLSKKKKDQWLNNVRNDMRAMGTTIAWVNKGVTAISIKNSQGQYLPWMNLGIFGIDMSAKVMKRLAALAWRSYLNGMFERVVYTTVDKPVAYVRGQMSVAFIYSRRLAQLHDGVSFMRPELFEEILERITPELVGSEEKAERLRKELSHSKRFNIRLILPYIPRSVLPRKVRKVIKNGGLIKGDIIITKVLPDGSVLAADIVTHIINVKPELYSTTNAAYLQMFRQEQYGRVRTNRQALAHFFKWLYDGHIQDALKQMVADLFTRIKAGLLPDFIDPVGRTLGHTGWKKGNDSRLEQDDSINAFSWKYIQMIEAGVPLTRSPAMLQAIYQMCKSFLHPKDREEDERRFPVPYAKSASFTSRSVAVYAGYNIPPLRDGEVFYHSIGAIVSDETFAYMAYVSGTADEDDHFDHHIRRSASRAWIRSGSMKGFVVRKGDLIAVTVRNPIGGRMNGSKRGSEYYVLRVKGGLKHFRIEGKIPEINLRDRPRMITEVNVKDQPATFVPTGPVLPLSYTWDFVTDQMGVALTASREYGGHALLIMGSWWLNIITKFQADEAEFVDSAQQKPSVEDMSKMKQANIELALWIVAGLRRITKIDRIVAGRPDKGFFKLLESILEMPEGSLWSELVGKFYDGPFTELIEFHRRVIQSFDELAREHILECVAAQRIAFSDVIVDDLSDKGTPELLHRIHATTAWYMRLHNDDRRARGMTPLTKRTLTGEDYANIAGWVIYFSINEKGDDHDRLVDLAEQTYAYRIRAARKSERLGDYLGNFLEISDKELTNGPLLGLLIEVLARREAS